MVFKLWGKALITFLDTVLIVDFYFVTQWCSKRSDIGHGPIHCAKFPIDLPPIQSNDRSKLCSNGHCPIEFHLG
jgi:hypothetical protein